MTYYVQPHVTQFDGSSDQGSACVPTSLANGIAASTGGARRPAGVTIHRLIPHSQETDPHVPGWSLTDADRAMAKIGVGFDKGDESWTAFDAALDGGHYCILQGDSDHFGNNTCSGKFNGDHCIGINPKHRIYNGRSQHWIDDGICPTGRWEYDTIIYAYAKKLADASGTPIRWCASIGKVPKV